MQGLENLHDHELVDSNSYLTPKLRVVPFNKQRMITCFPYMTDYNIKEFDM